MRWLEVAEARRLRQIKDENAHLKRLVADLTLDKYVRASGSHARGWALSTLGGG
jgi:hypothetical protein